MAHSRDHSSTCAETLIHENKLSPPPPLCKLGYIRP